MAIPDTYTFCLRNVCAEIQFAGATGSPTPTLSNMLDDTLTAGFDSTYSGTTSCLRNFRNYKLNDCYTNACGAMGGGWAYDYVRGYMWGTWSGALCIHRIDPTTNAMTKYTSNVGCAEAIAFDGNCYMWYTGEVQACIGRIDVTNGAVTKYGSWGKRPYDIVLGNNREMWTADWLTDNGAYSKITSGGTRTAYTCNCFCRVLGIAFDGTNIWVAGSGTNNVAKINPSTGAVIGTYSLTGGTMQGCNPYKIVFNGTDMWTVNTGSDTFSRISLDGSTITEFSGTTGGISTARYMAVAGENVWVTNSNNTLTRITPSGDLRVYSNNNGTNTAFALLGVNCDDGRVWVSTCGTAMSISKFAGY